MRDERPAPKLLRVRDFALILGLPLPTAYRMVQQGLVKSVRIPVTTGSADGVVRIPVSEVDRLLGEPSPESEP